MSKPVSLNSSNSPFSVKTGTSKTPTVASPIPFSTEDKTPVFEQGRFEARRVLNLCNVCGYCNGFCDVFDAAQRRPALLAADSAHLAYLCHGCRNCLYSCQYAPPHPFAINVPRTLTQMRQHTDIEHLWPSAFASALRHSARTTALVTGSAIVLLIGLLWLLEPNPQATGFYRVLPLSLMIWLAVIPLGWSLLALGISWRRYWRFTRPKIAPVTWRTLALALQDVVLMRNLRGGNSGCNDVDERFSHLRRRLHQGLLFGLSLSFAATLVASIYHHMLGWIAPYPIVSIPVLLGTSGGILMVLTTTGLLTLQWRGDSVPTTRTARTANSAALLLLWTVATTGLALLIGRDSAVMALLLALHLGGVIALFALLPYSKLTHAGYRIIALIIEHIERQ